MISAQFEGHSYEVISEGFGCLESSFLVEVGIGAVSKMIVGNRLTDQEL